MFAMHFERENTMFAPRLKYVLLMLLCLTMFSVGCRSRVPVQNTEHVAVPQTRSGQTLNEVEDAIIRGATAKGWIVNKREGNIIRATLNMRNKHTVVVDIPYTSKEFSIKYVSSSGMKYQEGKIHPQYNTWIENLRKSIYRELGKD